MDHRNFLETARKLLRNAPTEADIRTVVNRAYYAVHLHVSSWWNNTPDLPKYRGGAAHTKIPMALRNTRISEAKEIGRELDDFYWDRRLADYEMRGPKVEGKFNQKFGQWSLIRAQDLINKFDKLDKRSLKQSLMEYFETIK